MKMEAPRVFLSYASDDQSWVKAFCSDEWFGNQLGNVKVVNYLADEGLPFGELAPWIEENLQSASAVIAFVSEHYYSKKWTVAEWSGALGLGQSKKLIFVPIMLDADARTWWAELKKKGGLTELPIDYQYLNFADGKGNRLHFKAGETEVSERVTRLAHKIRELLREPPPALKQLPLSNTRADKIILLGHPSANLPVELISNVNMLNEALRGHGLATESWRNGWKDNPEARGMAPASSDSNYVFVRPLAETEAGLHAAEPHFTGKQLGSCGLKNPRVALWLPSGSEDKDFCKTANSVVNAGDFPALRTDTPSGLADWLRGLLLAEGITSDLVLQIEDLGSSDDRIDDGDLEARRLATDLREGFCAVVNREVHPEPDTWPYWGDQFRQQIAMLPGSRAIVAIHDLNITPTADQTAARKAMERKFEVTNHVVDQTLRPLQRKLDLFKTALVVRNADALPFASYPSNGRWKDWKLLSFERVDPTTANGKAGLKPVANSHAVFRLQLRAWAAQA
jgi:TIR domain